MGLSSKLEDYEDVREHMDRAVASTNGIRVNLSNGGGAINLRQRMYKLRQLEKRRSLELYEVGDERRAKTVYDNLTIMVVGNSVEIRHGVAATVEDL